MKVDNIKVFNGSGMDQDSAAVYIAPNDIVQAFNARVTGTTTQEGGYVTNPESTQLITQTVPAGINKGTGGGSFEDLKKVVFTRYNSAGNNQIVVYDNDTQTETVIFEDITDTGGEKIFPLNPQNYVKFILIDETYLVGVANGLEVFYTNLNTLTSGGYGTVLAEDISLLKPPCAIPIAGAYVNDAGKAANFLKGFLFQAIVQYINDDFNYSAWSTWSKRIIPPSESTPIIGTDVSQNNCIVFSVDIGSVRATTLNIAVRFGLNNYSTIKTVTRAYIVALPDTSVDVSNQVFEAYDPSTNLYSFAFYNQNLSIPVNPTETDLYYDNIWPSNALERINGNIIALGDLLVGYLRPATSVTIGAVGYNPNIDVPVETNGNPIKTTYTNPGQRGTGIGHDRRRITITFGGVPQTGDEVIITEVNLNDANNTTAFSYIVPFSQSGHLDQVVNSIAEMLPYAVYTDNGSTKTVAFIAYESNVLQSVIIILANSGATVSKSIHSVLDNSSYQLALQYFDSKIRPFPLDTDNSFIVQTPSYAQVNGGAIQISWTINDLVAPLGADSFQWLITKNATAISLLDVMSSILKYLGSWDAHSNTTPMLQPNMGNVGDTYQITTPNLPTDTALNLGNGPENYKTGDYVSFNGKSWDIIPKEFGDLSSTGGVLAIKINPLSLFNQTYSNEGVNTVLSYDFTPGDRCTFHYYVDGGVNTYINTPCVDTSVYGYDPSTFILKIEKPSTIDLSTLAGKDLFIRLYTPNTQQAGSQTTADNTTVWYEIGERFTITDGNHDQLTGIITDGDVYYKTRQYDGAVDPSVPYGVFATDFNFSDFYPSAFTSYGRPRTFYSELEKTERKAITTTSQSYILGSRVNGLNRFYPANVYGDADGQTSSSYGAIQVLWQRGDVLVIIQELGIFYVPVNIAYLLLNDQITGTAISEKLLNNGRYETKGIGIGLAKEAFCYNENVGYMIDPHRSEPFEITTGGVFPISGKMSKYFKQTFALAYQMGRKIVLFYNKYYDEVMCCIEAEGGILTLFPFTSTDWNQFEPFTITPSDILLLVNGAHSTGTYDHSTGMATITPTSGYVGNDVAVLDFTSPTGQLNKNICLNWTAGDTSVTSFSFTPQINQPLNTEILSNIILVDGINVPVPISITGGQYAVNGGAFTSISGTVNQNDTVQVQCLSSTSNSTTTSCTLTISSQSGTFDVTTIPSGGTTSMMTYETSFPAGSSGNFNTTFTLSTYLSADIHIKYRITYTSDGTYSTSIQNLTLPAGTLAAEGYLPFSFPGTLPISQVTITVISVVPNPSGGTMVVYTSPQTTNY